MVYRLAIVVMAITLAVITIASISIVNRGYEVSLTPSSTVAQSGAVLNGNDLTVPEAPQPTSTSLSVNGNSSNNDLPDQQPLSDPPTVIKAVYATAWTAGSPKRMASLIDLIKTTNLNAIVIDVKDYSGYVSYAMDIPLAKSSGAEDQIRISRPNALIKELHDNGIYVIGRIVVFEDPVLAAARPDLAIKDATTGQVWKDKSGLSWLDPSDQETWNYVADIANDMAARGFDEVNFDYVRFPSDGSIGNLSYPFFNPKTMVKSAVIEKFFSYLHDHVTGIKTSADVFGLTTVATDDMGIGQIIQDAAPYFDYIAPMVYPSHYANGFIGYKNPADYPYQVIVYSMENAVDKFLSLESSSSSSSTPLAKFRPWLQDFNLGAVYTPQMIQSEIQAVTDSLCITQPTGDYPTSTDKAPGLQCAKNLTKVQNMWDGWMLWNPSNHYTASGLGLN